MEITKVRVLLTKENSEHLRAFCSVTFDDVFVVHDLKIIEGTKGLFVSMPSRKLTARCRQCGGKNHMKARYCNQCGGHLEDGRVIRGANGWPKLHIDLAHPINSVCRRAIQSAVIEAFQREEERSRQPGYVSTYDEY